MMAEARFYLYDGDLIGLPTDENHMVFRWLGPGKVLFSVCRRGNGASCHFASDKKGLRYLKKACNDFVEFVFKTMAWCKMCFAIVNKKSVINIMHKIGFALLGNSDDCKIYVRLK